MARNLLVVESPAKARTIKKYLGPDYEILASYGHVRDLVPKNGAVEPDNGFLMHYEPIERNEKHVKALGRAMKKAKALYLATDPDREGEAISWHVVELLRAAKALGTKPVHRVVFHEITKRAIAEAVERPREISDSLVNAQQARRALDYLVGFNLSPLLWKKIRRGLSAGRVQSPALRMIVEREDEIERFEKREYWTIEADLESAGIEFAARLVRLEGGKVEQFSITDEAHAARARDRLATLSSADGGTGARGLPEGAAGALCVHGVEKKQRRRNPAAPFITSTLQQEAARKLGFTASRTMRVAQQLYEGVDTGSGSVGLITYMRTDSTTLAAEAVTEIREYIASAFGARNVPRSPRVYRTRARNAQEAHEAIRPTSVARTPESLAKVLAKDQARLYELVWKRTVACQMLHATIDTVAVEFTCGARAPAGCPGPRRPAARHRIERRGSGLPRGVRGGPRRQGGGEGTAAAAAGEGRGDRAQGVAAGAALHRAAAPLLRGDPDPRAGRLRDRPPLDLCGDHLDASATGVRGAREPPLPAHRRRPSRQRLPDRAFRRLRGL